MVRYQQHVGGLPVMGGELVVSLRPNRELDSILAHDHLGPRRSPAAKVASTADGHRDGAAFFQGSAGKGAPGHGRVRWAAGSSTRR